MILSCLNNFSEKDVCECFKMAKVVNKKGAFRPKSRDLSRRMGSRTVEVRPVGAWVQPAVEEIICYEDAVVSSEGFPSFCTVV
jgi:hypothetical protein